MNIDMLGRNWKVESLLGEGSYGKVYKIVKQELGQTYAAALKVIEIPQSQSEIKTVESEGLDEESVREYFRSVAENIVEESKLMYKLKGNTNIVSYEDHSVEEKEDGVGYTIYIRMELLTPFIDYIKDHALTVEDILRVGIDMCKALEVCGQYNIVHRDIKPENIFVSGKGDFKLGDFGIAREIEKTSGMSKKGTYTYVAPEVFRGEAYNASVDIYSLGIVLYRLLNNNRTPFLPTETTKIKVTDKEQANMRRLRGESLPRPCNADNQLADVVLKACAYNPADRYSSPTEFRMALEQVLRVNLSLGKVVENKPNEYIYTNSSQDLSEENTDTMLLSYGNMETAPLNKNNDLKDDDALHYDNDTSLDDTSLLSYEDTSLLNNVDYSEPQGPPPFSQPPVINEQERKFGIENKEDHSIRNAFLLCAAIICGIIMLAAFMRIISDRYNTRDTEYATEETYLEETYEEETYEEETYEDDEYSDDLWEDETNY